LGSRQQHGAAAASRAAEVAVTNATWPRADTVWKDPSNP
jgi:hypothetical protein